MAMGVLRAIGAGAARESSGHHFSCNSEGLKFSKAQEHASKLVGPKGRESDEAPPDTDAQPADIMRGT